MGGVEIGVAWKGSSPTSFHAAITKVPSKRINFIILEGVPLVHLEESAGGSKAALAEAALGLGPRGRSRNDSVAMSHVAGKGASAAHRPEVARLAAVHGTAAQLSSCARDASDGSERKREEREQGVDQAMPDLKQK